MDYNIQLTNGKIALLPYHKKYIKDLHYAAIESMAELMPWMAWMHPGYSVEESKKWVKDCPKKWDKGTSFNFAITDASDGSYIGGCGIGGFDPTRKIANLGYWVRTAMTKRGIATAAASLLAKWGIEELNLQRIEIAAALPNLASQRVAEKVGAHREGILRNHMVVRDLLYDEVMFSIIPQDIKKPDSV
jgi:RimJ/RimL family protein N-acetyltransferase